MAIPAFGSPISLSQLAAEYGGTGAISLSQFYSNGGRVPSGQQGKPSGTATSIPTSGAISLNSFASSVYVPASDDSWTGNSIGGTGPTSNLAYSKSISGGFGINQLHVIVWGGGGAGAQWPSGAPGGYGGAGYRVSFIRGQNATIDNLLNSITSINGNVGDQGSYQNGRLPDASRNGGPGGSSTAYINGATLIARAKGGNGSRNYWTNGDANFVYATNSGSVGDNGGAPATAATYGGGGGGSGNGAGALSTYGGRGNPPGVTPAGGGSGIDNAGNYNVVGGYGRVRIIINAAAPF